MDPVVLAREGPVAILLAGIVALFLAFIRGDLVPGYLYRAAVERSEKAETQSERSTEAVEDLTKVVRVAVDELQGR